MTVPAGKQQLGELTLTIPNPKRRDLKSLDRYVAVTILIAADGMVPDCYETAFGVRTIRFDPNQGTFLTGQHIEINGVCDHADLGATGTAVNTQALQHQIEVLQSMDCNATCTSHNTPAPEMLNLCDKMGMLVMDEAFDCWAVGKNPGDYHVLLSSWHGKDLRALVCHDRNHPCVILWSTGMESRSSGTRITASCRNSTTSCTVRIRPTP